MHNFVFKHQKQYPQIEREFAKLDQRLARIVHTMAAIAWFMYRDYLVVTRIYEPKDDGSTHHRQGSRGPYRFIDLALLENGDSELLRKAINILFPYDVSRSRDTIAPLNHGTAPHMHVQVKP